MTRLSTVLLGVLVAIAVGMPATPAHAADSPGGALLAQKAKKKKKAKKPKKGKKASKKPDVPALDKGMSVVALADAALLDDPSEDAKEVARVTEGQVLTIEKMGKNGAWVRVKDTDGKQGWLRAAEVVPKEVYDAQGGDEGGDTDEGEGDGDEGGDEGDDEGEGEGDEGGDDGGKPDKPDPDEGGGAIMGGGEVMSARARPDGKIRIAAGAQLIGLARSQEFSSGGTNTFANYTLSITSPGAMAFARASYKTGKLEFGAEGAFMLTFGNGGITVGQGLGSENLTWEEQAIDGRALGGYHVSPGFLVSLRVGYRVLSTTISNSVVIKQPSELLQGVTVGAELLAYRLSPKLELRLGFETMLGASLAQTKGLEDGTDVAIAPYYLFVEGSYAFSRSLYAVVGYTLSYETYQFSGTSNREGANSNGTRNDLQHLVGLGAQYWF